LVLGAGDFGLPGAGDLGRPGGTGDLDTAGDGDFGRPGPGDLGRGGLVAPLGPDGCRAGALNEPMPNGSSDYTTSLTTAAETDTLTPSLHRIMVPTTLLKSISMTFP